jgi:hypothetical protein
LYIKITTAKYNQPAQRLSHFAPSSFERKRHSRSPTAATMEKKVYVIFEGEPEYTLKVALSAESPATITDLLQVRTNFLKHQSVLKLAIN